MGILKDFRFFSSKFKLYLPVLKQYFLFCSLFYVNINGENSTVEIFRIYSDLKATICCFDLTNEINKLSFNKWNSIKNPFITPTDFFILNINI